MKEVNDKNFNEAIAGKKLTMVDFWADWCGPCVVIAPILEQISREHSDKVNIVKCDVDTNPDLSKQFGIRNIPTVLFFKDGKLIDKQIGAISKSAYITKINELQ